MTLRHADFAGSWYPATAHECQEMFASFERTAVSSTSAGKLHGGIVPHAGWVFSGGIAYNVIREVARRGDAPDTVILFGGHLGPRSPITVMPHGDFWTPLGAIPTDAELAARLLEVDGVVAEPPEHHTPDNTVELQAPLIKHHLPDARIVVIGASPRDEAFALIDALADGIGALGRGVVAIGSTDLTHYGPNYGWAPKGHGAGAVRWVREDNDPRFIALAETLDGRDAIEEALSHANACCPGAAAAAMELGKRLGATRGELLAYATSADVRPDPSFVGYAGIVF